MSAAARLWQPGDTAVVRGVYQGRVWSALATTVAADEPDRTALLLEPGAECLYPDGFARWRQGDFSRGTRWQEARRGDWGYHAFTWERNRFLVLLEPGRFYGTFLIWAQATGEFQGYYINFQLPYRRSRLGFDTLDLELDLVIAPDLTWHWKDEAEYSAALEEGGIGPDWAAGIEAGKADVLSRLAQRRYPFDGSWLEWQPPREWAVARLPGDWDEMV